MIEALFDWVLHPWPWYVGGPLIGLFVPALLYFGNRHLGVSASLQHLCRVALPARLRSGVSYFDYDARTATWNLLFVLGIVLGGALSAYALPAVEVSDATRADLAALGITDLSGLIPTQIFQPAALLTPRGLIFVVVGGFLVGFGARYANGCTSGHSIMGLSLLSPASLAATVCFFAGGLFATHLIIPWLLSIF